MWSDPIWEAFLSLVLTSLAFSARKYPRLCLKWWRAYAFKLQNFNSKIFIHLRYYYNRVLLDSLTIISKPSNTKYVKLKDLYKLNSKKKLFILSTAKGLKSLLECKMNNIGGKLLFVC
jgi:ribosomal protein S8